MATHLIRKGFVVNLLFFFSLAFFASWVASFWVEATWRCRSTVDDHAVSGVKLTRGNIVLAKYRRTHADPSDNAEWTLDPWKWNPAPLDFNDNICFLASDLHRSVHGSRFTRDITAHWNIFGFAYQSSCLVERLMKAPWIDVKKSSIPIRHPDDCWVYVIPGWPILILVTALGAVSLRNFVKAASAK